MTGMNRRSFTVGAGAAALLGACGGPPSPEVKPNLLVVLLDDLGQREFPLYNPGFDAAIPVMRRLASQGVWFRNAYATPICAASRVELLTGRYAHRTGVYHNQFWLRGREVYDEHPTFAARLKSQGYATAIAGKWNAGSLPADDPMIGFDETLFWPGYPELAMRGLSFDGPRETANRPSRYWHPAFIENGALAETGPDDFSINVEAAFLERFMRRRIEQDEPFCAFWSSVAPHDAPNVLPLTPDNQGEGGDLESPHRIIRRQARLADILEYFDARLGAMLERLEAWGALESTLIMVLSDNGSALLEKAGRVEVGALVPAIMAGYGVAPRGKSTALTDFSDIAPTLLDFAGAPAPAADAFDGKSLKPFLSGARERHRDWIHSYLYDWRLLRTDDYLLEALGMTGQAIERRLFATGGSIDRADYALVTDDPAHAEALERLTAQLDQMPAIDPGAFDEICRTDNPKCPSRAIGDFLQAETQRDLAERDSRIREYWRDGARLDL